jgi:hypothetical protein
MSLSRSTHVPLHTVSPVGHVVEQTPLTQAVPAAHLTPHAPQFRLSLVVFVQRLPHTTLPFGHEIEHVPLTHA